MNNKYLVYVHIFPNGKKYYGITKRKVEERWINGNGYKRQKTIYNAIEKYGWGNIKHIIISNNLTFEQACEIEKILILINQTNQRERGYNRSSGGEKSAFGYKHTEEEKKKIKEHNAKYWQNKKRGSEFMKKIALNNHNRKGKKHSDKSKQLNRKKHSIAIFQYDLKDNLIRKWECIKDAEAYYNLPLGSISKVCKGKRKTAGGYKWEYINKEWGDTEK